MLPDALYTAKYLLVGKTDKVPDIAKVRVRIHTHAVMIPVIINSFQVCSQAENSVI